MSKIPVYCVVNQQSMKKPKKKNGEPAEKKDKCCCDKEDEEEYQYNFDPRDILVVGGLEADNETIKDQKELMSQMWAKGKPPPNLSEKKPVVSARQLELVRAQMYGKMNRRQRS